MTERDDVPLSPLDAEIEMLLDRLAALRAREPAPDEASIREVALLALRERLRELSRRCTDSTCRVRVVKRAREAAAD
jgi:hypothetical protein